MTQSRLKIIPLLLYLVLIFFLSSRPHLHPPGSQLKHIDKFAHVVEFFILGVLLFEGIGRGVSRWKLGTALFLFAVGASIGALDEIFQSYIPGREMSVYDWIADAVGVGAGAGFATYLRLGKRAAPGGYSPPPSEGSAGA